MSCGWRLRACYASSDELKRGSESAGNDRIWCATAAVVLRQAVCAAAWADEGVRPSLGLVAGLDPHKLVVLDTLDQCVQWTGLFFLSRPF